MDDIKRVPEWNTILMLKHWPMPPIGLDFLEKEKEKEEAKKTTRKPGRPRKTKDSQVVQQQSQAKYSLRSHAQSN